MSKFIISLDFEMFWGVSDSQSIKNYHKNVEGEWEAIPRMLALFRNHQIRATWATVGMLMCKDYAQWSSIRPDLMPTYTRTECSSYNVAGLAKEFPKLFFARELVEKIQETPGQEIGSHTYSHFYCGESGIKKEQFLSDLACAKFIANEIDIDLKSIVFPRNQVFQECLQSVSQLGMLAYRGNPDYWIYKEGHEVPFGFAGKIARISDSYIPISGDSLSIVKAEENIVNIPASMFLRPWLKQLSSFEPIKLKRIKNAMYKAAVSGENFHLWWHPHNFGINIEQNLRNLEDLLNYFEYLRNHYGMQSNCMSDFVDGTAS